VAQYTLVVGTSVGRARMTMRAGPPDEGAHCKPGASPRTSLDRNETVEGDWGIRSPSPTAVVRGWYAPLSIRPPRAARDVPRPASISRDPPACFNDSLGVILDGPQSLEFVGIASLRPPGPPPGAAG
jgi:hypothetical protein